MVLKPWCAIPPCCRYTFSVRILAFVLGHSGGESLFSSCMESLQYTFCWQLLVAFKIVFTLLCLFWLSIKKALLLASVLLIGYPVMKCVISGEKTVPCLGRKWRGKKPHSNDQKMHIFIIYKGARLADSMEDQQAACLSFDTHFFRC